MFSRSSYLPQTRSTTVLSLHSERTVKHAEAAARSDNGGNLGVKLRRAFKRERDMSYVQVDQGVVTHRKTLRLARLLGESRYAVVGRLVALWAWCLDSAISGELRDVDAGILADVMGWEGKPSKLFVALITVGFLDLDEDGVLRLHASKQVPTPLSR